MDKKEKTQVVMDETTIYEIDLDCIRRDEEMRCKEALSEKEE